MKKKIIITTSVVAALLLVVVLITSNLSGLTIVAADSEDVYTQSSESDESWKKISEGAVSIENDHVVMELDAATTHFTVTDKNSGKVYHSVPQKIEGFEPKEEQQSEVIITYYGNNSSAALTMNSYENSVEGQSFQVKTDGSAIRVYYSIQKSKVKIFVPEVFSQEVFEEDILTKLESGPKRRLKSFYTLYQAGSESAKKMESEFPALAEESLYVLNDTVTETIYAEITSYMEMTNYEQSAYEAEMKRLGLGSTMSANQPAAFVVPIEYKVTENGFSATILNDRITSDSSGYTLANVSVLPYFASCGTSQKGWFLVPDGSGAIIELAQKPASSYSQALWGNDMAVEYSVQSNIMQNAGLPVFAFHNGNEAYFAEVTGSAASASIRAEVYGNEVTQSHIYTDFLVRSYDTSDIGAVSKQGTFNIFASEYMAEFPQVCYTLFTESSVTYSDMANAYRDTLVERGVLKERLQEESTVPLYVDFIGYEAIKESVLGVDVDEEIVLSSIDEIEKNLAELEERGVENIHVRLKAYANGGIYGTVANGFQIHECVGTEEELQLLAEALQKKGGKLYLENNISTVYKAEGSFEKMTHAVRSLRRTVAEGFDFDLIARTRNEAVNEYYMTSPAYFLSLTENFINTLSETCEDVSVYGYSWSDFGSKLWSDFRKTMPYDRTQSVHTAVDAVEKAGESFEEIMTDGSNAFVLSEVSTILNMPLGSSALSCESYSIPFYQMVIHGYIDYSGSPINTGADLEQAYLSSIESGANLYYSCYTSNDEPLKDIKAGTLIYPTHIAASYDRIEEQYAQFSKVFSGLRSQTIIRHTRVADDVFVTTYEDGTQIAVNYSDVDIEVDGVMVSAKGFTILERGDN